MFPPKPFCGFSPDWADAQKIKMCSDFYFNAEDYLIPSYTSDFRSLFFLLVRADVFVCTLFKYVFVNLNVTRANFFMLIVFVVRAGLFEQPTGREHKLAENGWKLSKVGKVGSDRFGSKTGEKRCWPIRYGQQHSLSLLYSDTSVFVQKSIGSSRVLSVP